MRAILSSVDLPSFDQGRDVQSCPQGLNDFDLGQVHMQRRDGDFALVYCAQIGSHRRIAAYPLEADPVVGVPARVDTAIERGGLQIALALRGDLDAFDGAEFTI